MNNKVKILYIVPSLRLCNGVASYAMNYFKNIDKSKIQIDFLIANSNEKSPYFDDIKKQGGDIFYIPFANGKKIIQNITRIKRFFKENAKKYSIVHCHVLNSGAIYLHYAKKYGIKVRILHSHVTKTADSKSHEFRNKILLPVAIRNANHFCACSDSAGKRIFKDKKFKVINNAIDGSRFKFNQNDRDEIRKQYKIDDKTFVIGNVGRLCNQKNQKFLLDVFKLIQSQKKDTKLMIVGNGPLEKELKEYANKLSIEDKVFFINTRLDIEKMYQAFDVFVLPSIYEGLGIVLIEAQTSGLPCVVSDVVPKEAKISDKYEEKSLNDTYQEWADIIIKNMQYEERITNIDGVIKNNYDIKTEAKKLEEYYIQLVIERK